MRMKGESWAMGPFGEWLSEFTPAALAREIGRTESMAYKYGEGTRRVPEEIREQIETLSGGRVTAKDVKDHFQKVQSVPRETSREGAIANR